MEVIAPEVHSVCNCSRKRCVFFCQALISSCSFSEKWFPSKQNRYKSQSLISRLLRAEFVHTERSRSQKFLRVLCITCGQWELKFKLTKRGYFWDGFTTFLWYNLHCQGRLKYCWPNRKIVKHSMWTKKHSSRMLTAVAVGGGVCFWEGGSGGVSAQGGVCPGGVCPGVSARGGVYPSMHWADTPLWTEWLTDRCKNITFLQLRLRAVITS